MNRRDFIRTLGASLGVASLSLDPERALWVPRKKLISIPRPTYDPRFLVHVKAGKSGYYGIPEGDIRRITQALPGLPGCEVTLNLVRFDQLWCAAKSAIQTQAVVAARHAGVRNGELDFSRFDQQAIRVWPTPERDTVLAVEYAPLERRPLV